MLFRLLFVASLVYLLSMAYGASRTAHATSFTVDSTIDAVDANPGDGVCATAAGKCTLRAAVQETNALPGPDVITLPAGTYVTTIPLGEDLAARGDFDILDDLTLVGAGASTTIIDGGGLDRVISGLGGVSVDISGVTITNGSALSGGGLNGDASFTLTEVVIANNIASNYGGGIFGKGDSAIVRSAILNNTSTSSTFGFGGGVGWELGNLTIEDSLVAGNSAAGSGGGIYGLGAVMTITNTTITGNSALDASYGEGGGIHNDVMTFACIPEISCPPSIHGDFQLTNVTISGNTSAKAGGAGGVYGGATRLKNSVIANNTPVNCGAGNASQGHNISSDSSCAWSATGDFTQTDPLLGPLANHGGPTMTHAPQPGSPVIDSGDDTACPATDQRGAPRPADGDGDSVAVCDRGAVEVVHPDSDGDGIPDLLDNCPAAANAGQENNVHPLSPEGDACEDPDADAVVDADDNCPDALNPGQENDVHPLTPEGDACEDPDGDGAVDAADNCADVPNPSQANFDGDASGDACDDDDDNDGFSDATEAYVVTGPLAPCGTDGWPAELADSGASANKLTLSDLTAFLFPLPSKLNTSPGDAGWDQRYDLTADGTITLSDITMLLFGEAAYPPMFGGERAFNGPECPWPG